MDWSAANRGMGAWGVRDGVDRAVIYVLVWHFFSWVGLVVAYLILTTAANAYEVYQKRRGKKL